MDTTLKAGNRRALQVASVTRDGWTKAKRRRFLELLANSCNVRMSCSALGMSASSIYSWRSKDPEFGAAWQAALQVGYDRLEQALLRRALATVDGMDIADAPAELPAMSVAQAMDFLSRHQRSVTEGRLQSRSNRKKIPTAEETDALILKRLELYDRRRKPVA